MEAEDGKGAGENENSKGKDWRGGYNPRVRESGAEDEGARG